MKYKIRLGRGKTTAYILGKYANRHGLIAGATGTGKTVTVTTMIEGFSRIGVPCFVADIKGDISGIAMPGDRPEWMVKTLSKLRVTNHSPEGCPVEFWDLFGDNGLQIRTTIDSMGPVMLSRVFNLSSAQSGILDVAFAYAGDEGVELNTLADLHRLLSRMSDEAVEVSAKYGLVSKSSVAAILRSMLRLKDAGGDKFFGIPALDLMDFMRVTPEGRGIVNILAAERLVLSPQLYSTFLLWMLTDMYDRLPEIGDMDKPKFVFFFDEAHLMFDGIPSILLQRIEQIVRLIRSKGVGVYFCSQVPDDIPAAILGQLGNRVQHALRAVTLRDQKAIKAAAETFPINPEINAAAVISTMPVGTALVSTMQPGGIPAPVQIVQIIPPRCRLGPVKAAERRDLMQASPLRAKYSVLAAPTAPNGAGAHVHAHAIAAAILATICAAIAGVLSRVLSLPELVVTYILLIVVALVMYMSMDDPKERNTK